MEISKECYSCFCMWLYVTAMRPILLQKSLKTDKNCLEREIRKSSGNKTTVVGVVVLLFDQLVVCSIFTSPFGITSAWLDLYKGDTRKVLGTIHNFCPVENKKLWVELSQVKLSKYNLVQKYYLVSTSHSLCCIGWKFVLERNESNVEEWSPCFHIEIHMGDRVAYATASLDMT